MLVVLSLLSSAVSVAIRPPDPADAATTPWLNTHDRNVVIDSYEIEFGNEPVAPSWTGDRGTCAPGTTSQDYRASTLRRLNWFRSMAGVPATITENQTFTQRAQETALMNSVSERISHHPDTDFLCRTTMAVVAAEKSNLFLGATGPTAINGYVQDPGAKNAAAKHRNWILHPTLTQVGIGEVPRDRTGVRATNALYVVEDRSIVFGPQPILREPDGFVAWPPSGFVPSEVVYDRWSFSLRHANFSQSTVTIHANGRNYPASIEHQMNDLSRAPFPSLVWNVPGLDTNPTTDTAVAVTVSGVAVGGATKTFHYTTTILGDELTPAPPPAPTTDATRSFVTRAYTDFLGRPATSLELDRWVIRLQNGTTRLGLVSELAKSEEWTTGVVDELYLSTLGRRGDPSGSAYWAGQLRSGVTVAEAAAQFYGSSEYVNAAGSWSAWLTALYRELMGRPGEADGIGYWTGQTQLRGPGPVAFGFYQSDESRRRRVVLMYQQFLGRDPDSAGLAHWAAVLQAGDDLALAAYLASSEEYFSRPS